MVPASLCIEVAYSPTAGEVCCVRVVLPAGATVQQALRESRLFERDPCSDAEQPRVGIWGRACALDRTLRDGDRVELYRPLQVEPMQARRARAQTQRRRR